MTPAALGGNFQHEATMQITVTRQHNGTLLSTIHKGQYSQEALHRLHPQGSQTRLLDKFVRSS